MFQTTSQLSFIASQQLHTWRGVAGSPRCPRSPDPDCGAAAISSSAPFAAQQHLLRVGVVPKASFGQGKRGQLRGSRPWRLEEHIYIYMRHGKSPAGGNYICLHITEISDLLVVDFSLPCLMTYASFGDDLFGFRSLFPAKHTSLRAHSYNKDQRSGKLQDMFL